jgi:molecular chaperone Hsp33
MILSKPNDALVWGHCPQHRLRVLFVDVTDSARLLAERHANGSASALVLAQALAAVALLSADVEDASETVSLRIEAEGPVGGALVEASGAGDLRGYTRRKVLDELDERTDLNLADVLGAELRVQVVRAKADGTSVSKAALAVPSGSIREAVTRYFAQSLQIDTHAEVWTAGYDGQLDRAAAIAVQRLPDGDAACFAGLRDDFANGGIVDRLHDDTSLDGVRAALGLPQLRVDRTRALAFGCRCSRDRALSALAALSSDELAEIRKAGRGQRIACHMCGADYAFSPDDIAALTVPKTDPSHE